MPEPAQLPRPAVRAAAGLEADQAARQVGEEGKHLGARQREDARLLDSLRRAQMLPGVSQGWQGQEVGHG